VKSDDFNITAAHYFSQHIDSIDLDPLSTYHKCIVRKTILNDLDELNNDKKVLLHDRFVLRTYFDPYIQLPFTFVRDDLKDKMYFIWMPYLKEQLFNVEYSYHQVNDSIFALNQPVEVIKMPATLIDKFLYDQSFIIDSERSFLDAVNFSQQFLEETLSVIFSREISVAEFERDLEQLFESNEISEVNYQKIKTQLINPMFSGGLHDVQSFRLAEVGHCLIVYRTDKDSNNRFKVEIYHLPKSKRWWQARMATPRYRECAN
jgi:hypothetical protein